MLDQIDHRGKRFTIEDDDVDDERRIDRRRRAAVLERQAQRERHELEQAKAVAGPTGANLGPQASLRSTELSAEMRRLTIVLSAVAR
ncbi:hypothetical protein [Natronosalvus halobius]|uniref:hypothetical protein n=1 Tax=Natronosalvus halobius TaxID=2953746 RepID=UPI00209F4626|nr:hypothetical protein [Natronosalvus halobius]USZ73528.1 hypothetical protein NGM15_17850 [Natronosalvus halobius]